jgi:hypothetical protein
MQSESLESLFGTDFSIWNTRKVIPGLNRLFSSPYSHFFWHYACLDRLEHVREHSA